MEIDEILMGHFVLDIDTVISHLNETAGTWDGDNPGILEDRAHVALEAIDAAIKLKTLLDELMQYA